MLFDLVVMLFVIIEVLFGVIVKILMVFVFFFNFNFV